MNETELTRKLVFTSHLNVPERRGLPGGKVRGSVVLSVVEEALAAETAFWAWWLPDDSMAGCRIEYRGEAPCRVCWRYTGIQGEKNWSKDYLNWHEAAVDLVTVDWRYFGGQIDGIPIDQTA